MKKTIIFISFGLGIIFFPSCRKDSIQVDTTGLFQFAEVGNKWTYEYTTAHLMPPFDTVSVDTVTFEIVADLGNHRYAFNQLSPLGEKIYAYEFLARVNTNSASEEILDTMVVYNSEVGDTYIKESYNFAYYTVAKTDSITTFNNQDYSCFYVTFSEVDTYKRLLIHKEMGLMYSCYTVCFGGIDCYAYTHRLISVEF